MSLNKVSVIIPMYNAEKRIKRCLESIIWQTYTNLEIVVVNDGSTDKSLEIVKKIAQKDKRITLVTIKNQGVSSARNIGIQKSTGEYIIFVDADDYVEKEMIETLIKIINKFHIDVIVYDPVIESSNGKFIKYVTKNIAANILLNKEDIENKVLPWMYGNTRNQSQAFIAARERGKDLYADCYNAPWQAIYRKKAIRGIYFDECLSIYEDLLFNVKVFSKCRSMLYCEKAMYHYISNESDSLATKYYENYNEMKLQLYQEMLRNVDKNQLPQYLKKDLQYRIVEEILSVLLNECRGNKKIAMQKKSIKKYISVPFINSAIHERKSEKNTVNLLIFLLKYNKIGLAINIVKIGKRLKKGRK